MKIQFAPDVFKQLRQVKLKDKSLAERIEKQLILFQENPRYPSLRTHKLSGYQEEAWSISITRGFRMKYVVLDDGTAYFFGLGTHDQVYRRS